MSGTATAELWSRYGALPAAKRAVVAGKLRDDDAAWRLLAAEPIAVIGAACRVPGAESPAELWSLLEAGADPLARVPAGRWPDRVSLALAALPDGRRLGTWGGFLADVDHFDAAFFAISDAEAEQMDPQQRVLMEVAWEAIEDAGLRRDQLAGSATGVFVGACINDWARQVLAPTKPGPHAYAVSGVADSIIANRLSYAFDLRGPSLSVDTACSSSLVAVHLACQSLRLGECERAVVGGVSLMLGPEVTRSLARWGVLSPSGRCRSFDAGADGFVRSEGAGVLILEPLARALASGTPVRSVILGSATNQDGRSNGLTAPSVLAQEQVLRRALSHAGVAFADLDYVEAHGTGTPLGDPIELEALRRVAAGTESACSVGALKAAIGHCEAASGVLGLIKATLMLERERIVAQPHFVRLNPEIDLAGSRLAIATHGRDWPRRERPRRAGVSGFGFGGTNAHIVLEESPAGLQRAGEKDDGPQLLVLSARSEAALDTLVDRHRARLEQLDDDARSAWLAAAARRRTSFEHRLAVIGRARADFVARAAGMRGQAPERRRALVFVCAGQGAQYAGMSLELARHSPVVQATLEACATAARRFGVDLLGVLGDAEALLRTELAQPATVAVQLALAAELRRVGIEPDLCVGHSVGEIAAAQLSGALTLEEAMRIAVERGRAMRGIGAGAMLAVGIDAAAGRRLLAELGVEAWIAAENGPRALVFAGQPASLDAIARVAASRQLYHRRLPGGHAFHGPAMLPALAPLRAALGQVRCGRAIRCELISATTGAAIEGEELGAEYWLANVRAPVQFAAAVSSILARGPASFVELSPHPTLEVPIEQLLEQRPDRGEVIGTLRRGLSERAALLTSVGRLFVAGHALRWDVLAPPLAHTRVELPAYPFQRRRYPSELAPSEGCAHATDGVHRMRWDRIQDPRAGHPEGVWLVLGDGVLASALCQRLSERGGRVILVPRSDDGPGNFAATTAALAGQPVRAVICCWALDAESERAAAASFLHWVQFCAHRGGSTSTWVLTRGVASTGSELSRSPSIAFQAAAWGIARVVAIEHPELGCRIVDLDPQLAALEQLDVVIARVLDADVPATSAYRGARWLAPTLSAAQLPASSFDAGHPGWLVVTGGFGGIGRALLRWLAGRGARSLAVVSRHAPGPEARALVDELAARGVELVHLQADVGDERALECALAQLRGAPIRGVFHLAGAVDDAPIFRTSWSRCDALLRPKLRGTRNLVSVCRSHTALEFLVVFGSIAGTFGAAGQNGYAAGNTCAALVAEIERAAGFPITCVQWGPWAGDGMFAGLDPARVASREGEGIRAFEPGRALDLLGPVLASGFDSLVICDVDWPRFARESPLAAAGLHPHAQVVAIERASRAAPRAVDRRTLSATVESALRAVLGAPADTPIPHQRGFTELGMDSLAALALRARLQAELGCELPATIAFDSPCIEDLSAELEARLAPARADAELDPEEQDLLARIRLQLEAIGATKHD